MKLAHDLVVKRTSTATVGELIQFAFQEHRTLALVIWASDADVTVAVLKSDEDLGAPFFTQIRKHGYCVSYGSEWVLELVPGPESYPRNVLGLKAPGAILLAAEGPLLFLLPHEPERHLHENLTFNLSTNEIGSPHDAWPPYFKWRIWANDADRLSARGMPIVEIHATVLS